MTAVDIYQPAGQLDQPGIMTPDQARALDKQVRLCTEAVLQEGTDYGVIPGTNGEKTLWRPGAQKLLQWFRLECICERVDIERDDDGRKHGITYRAEVGRGLKTATPVILATCEGTADYDESKFYQDAETVRARLRDQEHRWAAKDRRVPNADRWNSAKEYRADWNALMKRAQKRAIVGAVVDATAAGGIFTDREEDDNTPEPVGEEGGPTWYEKALDYAHTFTRPEDGDRLINAAANAHKQGKCRKWQQDHIQNTAKKRIRKLQSAAVVVDAEDLAARAEAEHAQDAAEGTQDSGPAPSGQPAGNEPAAGPDAEDTLPVEDPPDSEWPETVKPGTGTPRGK